MDTCTYLDEESQTALLALKVKGRIYTFSALTCIDTMTNLVELTRINNKSSAEIITQFQQSWLSRYPRTEHFVHNNRGESIG